METILSSSSAPIIFNESSHEEREDVGEDEERLLIDLFREYNSLIRPVQNVTSPPVIVDFGVAMILLINVDEKNQILHTNVWLTMKWNDFQLRWNPEDYGNISTIHVPSDRVWLPDIVLFNNADGNYEVSFKSNAFVDHHGDVIWVPPAMFKSSCRIDVEWFPFDEQSCTLVFGSWTYNSDEVLLNWYNNIQAVQLTDYQFSGIWDVIDVPGYLVTKRDAKESRIVFNLVIRRKTLFYTVILIIPTVLMAFLSMMAFYLPADSGEKISLTISLLLALVVFLLLVSKILPPTSNIPLMGKYLLLAFVLNIITVVVTVIIVNVYFRSALSHEMPNWVRQIFLEFLPRFLMMKRPERIPIFNGYFVEEYCAAEIIDASSCDDTERTETDTDFESGEPSLVMPSMTATIVPFLQMTQTKIERNPQEHHENCSKWKKKLSRKFSRKKKNEEPIAEATCMEAIQEGPRTEQERISREMKTTVESIAYIAEHMKTQMSRKKIRDDWKYVAMVIDRLLLLVFFGITLGGTVGIILSAPHILTYFSAFLLFILQSTDGSPDEHRLTANLFYGYNSLVRPVENASSPAIQVSFSLALVLLINIDEKNQIMHTNVWPTMRWTDYQMKWDPRDYGGIRTIRVPPEKVWLPDIVLFNNADGNYLVSFYSNVVVEHTGEMLWVPPAVYKSSCIIDVEFFPFDEQVCSLTFGSWTFKHDEVQISHLEGKRQVELNDYSPSGIWDVIEVPGHLRETRSKISYQIRIRRKTLFYTVILIMPTVLMAFLSMSVFYLPCEASEKITLAISILLALVVFLLLVSKILPPTSSTIPLMAKYLLLTFVMNMITIMVTVVIINLYFRGPATHTMQPWVRTIFLKYLPLLLVMKRPASSQASSFHRSKDNCNQSNYGSMQKTLPIVQVRPPDDDKPKLVDDTKPKLNQTNEENRKLSSSNSVKEETLSDNAKKAIEAIEYITQHLTHDNNDKKQKDEWKFVSMVVDRLLLYIFFAVTATGTMGILFSAPNVFEYVDQTTIIENLKKAAKAEQDFELPTF
ncbi:unnamed protein product [Auanema sp. JU1783]|nr:unnamed protein product [Auanema sp. JU1783]